MAIGQPQAEEEDEVSLDSIELKPELVEEPSQHELRKISLSQHFIKNPPNFFKLYWRYIFAVVYPGLVSLVFILGTDKKIRCLYVELVMYGYWVFDVFPEGITGLIPIILLPVLMIQHTYTTCTIYFQYGFFTMITTFIAICIDYSGIHERLLLFLMVKFGGTPRAVHGVLSLVCAVMSIRMANAYTVQLFVPIIKKILYELDLREIRESQLKIRFSSIGFKKYKQRTAPVNLSMAFFTGMIHSSTIGGINFITGTLTNIVFKATFQRRYPNCNIPQTPWYCYTMPVSVVSFLASLMWVQILYLGLWRSNKNVIAEYKLLTNTFKEQRIIERLYNRLGNITPREIMVAIAFSLYLLIWYLDLFLYFYFNDQKSNIFLIMFIADSTPFLMITIALMFIPSNIDFIYSWSRNPKRRPKREPEKMISWGILSPRVPWGRIFVLGATIAMAKAQFDTGLAKIIASYLSFMKNLDYMVLLFIVTLFANITTEAVSNAISCGVFAPVIIEFAILCKIHPIHLGLPYTLVSSLGFLSKFASVTIRKICENAEMSPKDIFISGIFPKIYIWLVIYGTFEFYGKLIFNEDALFPKDFLSTNITCFCKPCPFDNKLKIPDW